MSTLPMPQSRSWPPRPEHAQLRDGIVVVEARVLPGVSGWENLVPDVSETIAWTCIALAYPLSDAVLLIEDNLRPRSNPEWSA